jgi:hypothetical protein
MSTSGLGQIRLQRRRAGPEQTADAAERCPPDPRAGRGRPRPGKVGFRPPYRGQFDARGRRAFSWPRRQYGALRRRGQALPLRPVRPGGQAYPSASHAEGALSSTLLRSGRHPRGFVSGISAARGPRLKSLRQCLVCRLGRLTCRVLALANPDCYLVQATTSENRRTT